GEAGLAAEGATLDETELIASASVDHLFYAETTLALHDDEGDTAVEIEEAFFDPVILPAGLGLRAGRFYSAIGYLNDRHSHTWDFHDEPLAYRAFLGSQYRDDGVRLKWTAPTDLYLNLGAELLAGNRFPGGSGDSTAGDARSLFAELGGDVGTGQAWQAGLSMLRVDANERAGGHAHGGSGDGTSFTGSSDLYLADFVWKWLPDGAGARRGFKLQGEAFWREEDGVVKFTEGTDQALLDYDGHQYGYYLQAIYSFLPRWRAGLRYDRLSANNRVAVSSLGTFTDPLEVIAESGFDDEGHRPERWSLMLDWSPSEFSRLRAQYNRDDSRPAATDHQWTLQYIMSLGAHGAHPF
ncbi:MAG: TonB-dependent receptor, partial [Gammaproteobacteria bacterium]